MSDSGISKEKFFEGMPADGTQIQFKRKGDIVWKNARVLFVWACEDSPAIKIQAADGRSFDLFVEFGDQWRAV